MELKSYIQLITALVDIWLAANVEKGVTFCEVQFAREASKIHSDKINTVFKNSILLVVFTLNKSVVWDSRDGIL